MKKIEKEISTILTESCKVSMRTFKEENRIALSDEFFADDHTNRNQDDEKEAFLVGDETHKAMPFT